MSSGSLIYPYAIFRSDLRNLGAIMKAERVLHNDGTWLDIGDDRELPQQIRRVWSYFLQRYSNKEECMEIGSAYMMAISHIEKQPERFAPGHDMHEIVGAGFEQVPEALLQAVHALCTEVDVFEWGDNQEETLEFIVELAKSRFGYKP